MPGIVFALAWMVIYLYPTPTIMAVGVTVGRDCTGLFLFNLYNYSAVAFPTRMRSVAFAWTDGLGHLGAWAGVTLTGAAECDGTGPSRLGSVHHRAGRAAAGAADPRLRHPAGPRGAGARLAIARHSSRRHGNRLNSLGIFRHGRKFDS